MGGTARSGSHLPEKSDCRIRQFARTAHRGIQKPFFISWANVGAKSFGRH